VKQTSINVEDSEAISKFSEHKQQQSTNNERTYKNTKQWKTTLEQTYKQHIETNNKQPSTSNEQMWAQ
jgi:hypothetical protein